MRRVVLLARPPIDDDVDDGDDDETNETETDDAHRILPPSLARASATDDAMDVVVVHRAQCVESGLVVHVSVI